MAKTVMGYSGNAELDALRAQAAANAGRSQPASSPPPNAPAAAPYSAPRQNPSQPPPMGGPQQPAPYGSPALAPASTANAATMFVPPSSSPGPGPMGPRPSAPAGYQPPAVYQTPPAYQRPAESAQPIAPVAPIPSAAPPYLASQTAARAGRPIEPWKDSLRMMMFIWGALLLAAFATPLSLEPLGFNWDTIINSPGTAKLAPLIMASVGLLSIVLAALPLASAARGMIAMLLGLAGIFVPTLVAGMPPWQALVQMAGTVILIPSLLARHEYRDAALPRILVTVGAIAALVPYVVPQGGTILLVELFKGAIDAPGAFKIIVILVLVNITLIVLSLLAWLPSPASGAAKPIAWVLILWGLVMHAALLFLVGDPSIIEASPYAGLVNWVAGGGGGGGGDGGGGGVGAMLGGAGLGVAYLAISGYGTASVIGKQLE